MTRQHRATVAVVGAGVAGLAAAWELVAGSGEDGAAPPVVHVFESGDRVGGKLASAEFAGRCVDLAADAFLARRPEATEICEELGLADQLVAVGATGASVWSRNRLSAMPEGLNLGVPTRWWPLARSGILGPAEALRVARDLAVPHRASGDVAGDRSVGAIVGERLGRPVVDRLVDPLIGGIHAGSVDDLSAAATFPLLIAASHQPGSFMRRMGRARMEPLSAPRSEEGSPAFWSLAGSTASLAEHLASALESRGVNIHTGTSVDTIGRGHRHNGDDSRWRLVVGGARPETRPFPATGSAGSSSSLSADGVVLAVPAGEAAVLLAPHAPEAAGMLSTIEYASVAVVTLSIPEGAIRTPLFGTGFLVPRTSTVDGKPTLITGCTYLGQKWPHLSRPGDQLLRASVGRFGDERHRHLDDEELAKSVFGELATILDIGALPLESKVTRWERAFPQYQVGHLIRVAQIEQSVARIDGMGVAGAALRGVGIPACIGSGRAAARQVLASLARPEAMTEGR